MNTANVTEKIIEDILSADKSILAKVLSYNQADLSQIARQKKLDSHRIIDLLYLHRNEILLIELKAVPFYAEVISQINDYYAELLKLQAKRQLIEAKIHKIILAPYATKNQIIACEKSQIKLIAFNIEEVLLMYYQNFKELSAFLKIQPSNRGVVRLYLLKRTLSLIDQGYSLQEIYRAENRSTNTIHNRLAVAHLIGLLEKDHKGYALTEFGKNVLATGDSLSDENFNAGQLDLISEFIRDNPFFSQITFSIMSVIDTIFILSKAEYPVPYEIFQDFFVRSLGKDKTWQTRQAQLTGTYHFANYTEELGFIQKIGNYLYLTPSGVQAMLIFQLNRSIKLINARK